MNRSLGVGCLLAVTSLLLCGCGTFPLSKVFVLGERSEGAPGLTNEGDLPHLDVKTVSVPDYLDTTDIVRRSASNEVVTSTTGRWGERLSVGITRALAADLTVRLPKVVIESRGAYEPSKRLLVDVEGFEISQTGRCIIDARWRIVTADRQGASNSERGTFIVTATSTTDAAVSLAMSDAIDQLAGRIADTVTKRSL